MALISSLSSSLTGMKVAQSQLEIISNNIANVDTQGYTRKTAAQSALVSSGQTMGVTIGNKGRIVDESLLKNFLTSNSTTSSLSTQYNYMSRLDNIMGTTEQGNSLSANVASLQSAFETFSTSVSSAASRYQLLTNAQALTSKLNYLSDNVQTLRGDADMQVKDDVANVNSLLQSINELNVEIVKYTVMKRDGVADIQDQRDNALRELSSIMDITYYTRDTGAVVVQTSSGVILLDNEVHELSHSALSKISPSNSYDNGNILGIFVDGKDITHKISGGSMGGAIDIRDNTLTSLQSQLDEISNVLINQINAVHNQGTAYPNMPYQMTGTSTFITDENGTHNQHIRIDSGDVRFIIFDENGQQVKSASLKGTMGFAEGSLDEMTLKIQEWMQNEAKLDNAFAKINDDGKLEISTEDSRYTISIMDEATSNAGSGQQDVVLSFNVNGPNAEGKVEYGQTHQGFSSFFGLNDFFVTDKNDTIYDSKVLNDKVAANVDATLYFSDSVNGRNYASVDISKSNTIRDIADLINQNPDLNTHVKASLIANGDGYMLRIESLEGAQLELSEENIGKSIINTLNLTPSSCGDASAIKVRENITQNANLIACGSPDFDVTKGVFTINEATNNIANKLADVFTSSQVFNQAGDMATTTTTIANYSSTFVGNVASLTSTSQSSYEYQSALTEAISYKEAQVSGIDLDEELAQMIIFQQSYAACAQVFTASREILDILLGLV